VTGLVLQGYLGHWIINPRSWSAHAQDHRKELDFVRFNPPPPPRASRRPTFERANLPATIHLRSVIFCEVVGVYGVIGCELLSSSFPLTFPHALTQADRAPSPPLATSHRVLLQAGIVSFASDALHRRQLLHWLLIVLGWVDDGRVQLVVRSRGRYLRIERCTCRRGRPS